MRRHAMLLLAAVSGCGGDARVELSAADAISVAARQMETTLQEYHQEVVSYDDAREASAVGAFVARVRTDASDSAAVDAHAAAFTTALQRIRADRETEWARRSVAVDNVGVLHEVARGLQRIGIESLSLRDEVRRYITDWMSRREQSVVGAKSTPPDAAK